MNARLFYSRHEALAVIESWRRECNTIRSHSPLGDLPPATDTVTLAHLACAVVALIYLSLMNEIFRACYTFARSHHSCSYLYLLGLQIGAE